MKSTDFRKMFSFRKFGFTLLEMIIVLAVLSLGFFPLIVMFSNGINASSGVSMANKAVFLATQKMEQVKGLIYSNINSSAEAMGSIGGYPTFSREVSATEESPNLKDVKVTVYWVNGSNSDSFNLETLITNY